MTEGKVLVYYGTGRGKSSAALGLAIRTAEKNETVGIIQFLKIQENQDFLSRLEPEIKIFRFERSATPFEEMSDEDKQEEKKNIENAVNYARKALSTEEFDLLILDEVFGILEEGMVDISTILELIEARPLFTTLVLTGRNLPAEIRKKADEVVCLTEEKEE